MKLEKGKISKDDKKDLIEKIQQIIHTKENQCQKHISEVSASPWRTLGYGHMRKLK
jgi:hypothetical protein